MLSGSVQWGVLFVGCVCLAASSAHAFDDLSAKNVDLPAEVSWQMEDDQAVDHLCGGDLLDGEQVVIDVRVRPGESLDHFARWTGTTVEEIAALNEVEITAPLYPGMGLMIPFDEHRRPALETARSADVEQRLARFMEQKGGLAGIAAHQVRTGETGWDIARRQAGVPVWVLAAFNVDKDLGQLSVGETLYLPIMGEQLGQAFDAAAAQAIEMDDESADWE